MLKHVGETIAASRRATYSARSFGAQARRKSRVEARGNSRVQASGRPL